MMTVIVMIEMVVMMMMMTEVAMIMLTEKREPDVSLAEERMEKDGEDEMLTV